MIRLAISMLLGARVKFAGVVAGVLFASFLITHFQGIFVGIMTRTYALISDMAVVDVWVMDPAVEYIDEAAGLPAPSLERVKGVAGVQWATRFFSGSVRARLPGGRFRSVNLLGFDDDTLIGLPETLVHGEVNDLRRPDAVFVDEASTQTLLRPALEGTYGEHQAADLEGPTRPLRVGDELTLNDRRVIVSGMTRMRPRFIAKGTFYTTYTRATSIAPPERNLLSFVLVKVHPGEDPAAVARRIESQTGLRAWTSREFSLKTVWYYIRNTDIVGQIGIMTLIAMSVGTAITGLLLYMFTNENLRFYGMLMAMGTSSPKLVMMVCAQGIVAGLCGYGLGVGTSAIMGRVMAATGLPYAMVWQSLVITAAFVLVVCVLASLMSVRQALKTEPGIVFRT